MKIEKLPSGSFRVRKTINGRTISMTFDKKPTQKEIQQELERRNIYANANHEFLFKTAAVEYMQSKKNVLSTTTIKNYESILKNLSDGFKSKKVDTITAMDVQREINDYSATRSPKSVKNASGFIAVVLSMYSFLKERSFAMWGWPICTSWCCFVSHASRSRSSQASGSAK